MRKKKKQSKESRPTEKRSINDPNEINDSAEIPMYAPNILLTQKEYQISLLNDFERQFKELCEGFLEKSNSDEFNSSYMDAVIERICVEEIKYIKAQRCDHVQLIVKTLDSMHYGDLCDAKNKLQYFLRDKEENDRELTKYRRIYWSGTSLAEEV